MTEIRVENLTRGKTSLTAGRVADAFWTRLGGLMGTKRLTPAEGLPIVPCKSIHTHFMHFAIDVLYMDAAQEVVGTDHALPPWHLGRFHRRSRFVIELPSGTVTRPGTQTGDQLQVQG